MKHMHRYQRVNIGHDGKDYFVMKCNLPECSHYTPMNTKLSCPLLIDKVAECNKCGENFILNRRALRMSKPICDDCVKHKGKTIEKVKSVDEFFKELESSIGIKE